MSANALLRELSERGIQVVVRGDRVTLRGPEGALNQELTERMRQHKPAILGAARRCSTCRECGAVITPDEPATWWGPDRVHLACGKAAWDREWRRN
jgi:hypothetical protein